MTPFWKKIRPRSRLVLFLFLSAFIVTQVSWWVIYQVRSADHIASLQEEVWQREISVAERLIARHEVVAPDSLSGMVDALFDDLRYDNDSQRVIVRQRATERLASETTDVARMFAYESATFLVIILAGMIYMYVTLRREILVERQYANFLSAVTHELRSPIAALRLLQESLNGELTLEQRTRVLSNMERSLDRLQNLIDRLLKTREFDGTTRALNELSRVDLGPLTRSVVHDLEDHNPAATDRLTVTVDAPVHARIDTEHWRILVSNLVDNALKYSDDGQPISVTVKPQSNKALLVVEDQGAGFTPSERQRIFQRFYRIGDENTRTTQGSGLGLYLVREIAHSFRGYVSASSDGPGKGATFTVQLPLAK
jgi:signal transduction histidine kinase